MISGSEDGSIMVFKIFKFEQEMVSDYFRRQRFLHFFEKHAGKLLGISVILLVRRSQVYSNLKG